MKRLLMLLILVVCSLNVFSQSFQGFFKPVPKDLFKNDKYNSTYFKNVVDSTKKGVWLFRFDAEVTAVQLVYNKTLKSWISSPLSSAGPGIGYKHYTEVDGEPYNDFGVNALVLLGYNWNRLSEASVSTVCTVNFLEYVNIGGGYDWVNKAPLVLLGATIKF
jgi:hypothetical protein